MRKRSTDAFTPSCKVCTDLKLLSHRKVLLETHRAYLTWGHPTHVFPGNLDQCIYIMAKLSYLENSQAAKYLTITRREYFFTSLTVTDMTSYFSVLPSGLYNSQ